MQDTNINVSMYLPMVVLTCLEKGFNPSPKRALRLLKGLDKLNILSPQELIERAVDELSNGGYEKVTDTQIDKAREALGNYYSNAA